jgi:hypothetical protein
MEELTIPEELLALVPEAHHDMADGWYSTGVLIGAINKANNVSIRTQQIVEDFAEHNQPAMHFAIYKRGLERGMKLEDPQAYIDFMREKLAEAEYKRRMQ